MVWCLGFLLLNWKVTANLKKNIVLIFKIVADVLSDRASQICEETE